MSFRDRSTSGDHDSVASASAYSFSDGGGTLNTREFLNEYEEGSEYEDDYFDESGMTPADYALPGAIPSINSQTEYDENRRFAKEAGLRYSVTQGGDIRQVIVPPAEHKNSRNNFRNRLSYKGVTRREALEGYSTKSGRALPEGSEVVTVDSATLEPPAQVIETQEDIQLRHLAYQLTGRRHLQRDRGGSINPQLARRLRDFQFAQNKRREKYGHEKPWGIMGLYDHLASIRIDIEWAEDAAWRRNKGEPYHSWDDFDEAKNKGFNQPFFTYILMVICTAMLVISIWQNDWQIEKLSINPMIGPSAETLIKLGAKQTNAIVNEGEGWRLITPMVLHAGAIHYLFNMMALWFIGSAVEQSHGSIAACIIFVLPAVGGTIISAICLPEYISVGASGGIFGLIGACIADVVINWSLLFSDNVNDSGKRCRHIWILLWLLVDIAFNSLLGLTPFVDNFTHLGGMIYGFLCGVSTMDRLSMGFFGIKQTRCQQARQIFTRFIGLVISVGAIMVTTIILLEGDGITSPCPKCSYVSCVPFPPWQDDAQKWWYCDDCGNISADARVSKETGLFDALFLHCPDGNTKTVELFDEATDDKEALQNRLPTFCKQYCRENEL